MLLFVGFFHCKSQKVKGAYSLILREKIKVAARKLGIDSSRYWFGIEDNDKFADRFRIKRGLLLLRFEFSNTTIVGFYDK